MTSIAIAKEGKTENSQKKIIIHLSLVLFPSQASIARLLEMS